MYMVHVKPCSVYPFICQFHLNRTVSGKVMTSNLFFKMAAVESEIYFRVQVRWQHSFKNVNIYLHTECPSIIYYNPQLTNYVWFQKTNGQVCHICSARAKRTLFSFSRKSACTLAHVIMW